MPGRSGPKSLAIALGIGIGMAPLCGSSAQTQEHRDWCSGRNNPTDEQIVAGCDGMIKTPFSVLNNRLGDAYYNRGLAQRRLGKLLPALTSFELAIAQNPNDADAYLARGNTRYDLRQFDRAVADFSDAIRINPALGLAYKNRSAAYASLGDVQRAIADYEKAAAMGVRD